MNTFTLRRALLLIGTIFISQSYGAEQEMRNLIEQKKIGRYGPSETFIRFSRIFDNSTPNDKATLVKIYEKLKNRDGDDSAIATIATEYGGQNVGEFAKRHGVEVAAIGARAYEHPDADWHRKPAAGPSYAAPYEMGAGGYMHPSSSSAAQYHNPNPAAEQEMLALAAEKAAGSYFTGRNATIDAFIDTYGKLDLATKEKIVTVYNKLKDRDGKDYVIAGMANDIKRTGIFAFLAGHGDDAPVPAASARAAAAPHYAVSPEAAAQMEMRNLIERKKKGPYGPSGLFINFAGIFDSLSQDQRNTLVRVYDKLKSRDGVDSAITTIALEYGNEGLEGMVRRHLENPLPAAGGGYGYGAQHGYHPPRAAEAVDDYALAQQLQAQERYRFAYDPERRAAEEAAGLELAQRLQSQEEADQRQRYAAAAYPAAQNFGAGGAAAAYRPQDAVAPIVAPVRPALQAAAVPAPNAAVAPEEFNDREMRILYDAYNVVMQRIQRPNAARIQQLEKEIHTQQRVLDSVAAEGRMAYSPAQIANAKRELETLVAERESV